MPLVKSMYPDHPPWAGQNYHDFVMNRPEVRNFPNFTLYIDGITGERRTLHEYFEAIADGATALGTNESLGGLGLSVEAGHFVGILSENCMVRPIYSVSDHVYSMCCKRISLSSFFRCLRLLFQWRSFLLF